MLGIICRCMLESQGFIVLSIPFYDWNSAEGPEQQKAYLSHLLASVYAFGYSYSPVPSLHDQQAAYQQ